MHQCASQVSAYEWALLLAVGKGYGYNEIAEGSEVTAGALRARVLRLRRILVARLGLVRPSAKSQASIMSRAI
jgi:DNA-directed RNA polymerase specialized sigma24 family protein